MSAQQRQQQFNEMMQRAKTTPVYQQTQPSQQTSVQNQNTAQSRDSETPTGLPPNFVGPRPSTNTVAISPLPPQPGTPEYNVRQEPNGSVWAIKGSTVKTIYTPNTTPPNFVGPPTQTLTGYEITTPQPPQQLEQQQSIGERLASFNPSQIGADAGAWLTKTITGKEVNQESKQKFVDSMTTTFGSGIPGIKGTPTEFVGGLVSTVESPIYAVATLAGAKNLPSPNTVSGGLVSSGIESVLGWKPTESQELKDIQGGSPAYAAGSVAGDLALIFIGNAAFKAVSPVAGRGVQYIANKNIPVFSRGAQVAITTNTKINMFTEKIVSAPRNKISGYLSESYKTSSIKNQFWRPNKLESFLMQHTGAAPKTPASGAVGLKGNSVSVGDDAFDMAFAPKTSLYSTSDASLGKTFKPYKASPNIPYNAVSSQKQLDSIEQMSNQPLPRQTDTEFKVNTDQFGFNKNEVSAKIDSQLKQAKSMDSDDIVDSKIQKVLNEANLERSTKPAEFITGINNDKPSNTNIQDGYLIKQPTTSNLNISDGINIRNPNIDVADAKNKMDSMLNSVPTKGSYEDYRSIMSQGQTTTATKIKPSIDTQLAYLEQLNLNPLPRTMIGETTKNVGIASNQILPASSPTKSFADNSRLIANINYEKVSQMASQQMSDQMMGGSSFTLNLLNRRILTDSASQVSEKINTQSLLSGLRSNIGLKTSYITGVAPLVAPTVTAIVTPTESTIYKPFTTPLVAPTVSSVVTPMYFPLANPPGTSGFDKYSPFTSKRSRKFLWEFPVMEPSEAMKDWF
jgi:hypothetical protein